ncbi:MAG: hypothetical protein WDM94_08010 [Bauldia sp.]
MRLVRICAALLALAAGAVPAHAAEPVEDALVAWIDGIDASPDWRASYGSLTTDPVTGRATLSGLSIAAEKPGFALTATRVTVDGYTPTNDGTFAAREIDIDGGQLDAGVYSIRLDHAAIEAPALPIATGFVWDDAQPFASAVRAFAPLLHASANGVTAGTVNVVETIGTVATWSTYGGVKLEGLRDGKIAALSAQSLRTDSPGVDPAGPPAAIPPLVSMTATGAETRNIDLDAMFAVYDPARYAGGVGDGVWRTAVGSTAYRDVALDIGNKSIAVTIAGVALNTFSMRQPKGKPPPDFGAVPPASDASPLSLIVDRLAGIAPFGVGSLTLSDLDIALSKSDKLHLGKLTLVQASIDAIGAFSIEDAESGLSGQGTVKIGKLAFGGLTVPPLATISAAMTAMQNGTNIDYSALVPPIGYVELGGIDVSGVPALPPVQLGRFRADVGNYIDHVPTSVSASLAGADVPASLIPDARAQQLLARYGYDRVVIDGGGKLDWAANGDVTVRDFSLGMKGVGTVSGEADLAAPPPTDMQHMAAVAKAPETVSLKGGTVSFKDDSLVDKAITTQATTLHLDPVKFREQFAKGLPFMLMLLGNKDMQAQLSGVLQTFIRTPGTITARAAPDQPMTIAALVEAAKTAPFSLFDLLNVSVSGVAGPAPAAPTTPPPAPVSVPAPANDIRGTTPAN